jgi:hypothetical protein
VITLPPLVVHSSADAVVNQPWPLQEFMPLHEELAVLHSEWPLQELMPEHFTVFAAEAGTAKVVAAMARPRAAVARTAPEIAKVFMGSSCETLNIVSGDFPLEHEQQMARSSCKTPITPASWRSTVCEEQRDKR